MNTKLLTVIKEQANNTMTTVGMACSTVYVMRHLGFDGQFVLSYESCGPYAFGLFCKLILKAYYSK